MSSALTKVFTLIPLVLVEVALVVTIVAAIEVVEVVVNT